MKLYPAIDIKDGQCVRLRKGVFQDVTVYAEHPFEVARSFQAAGASFIHTVDLDGALKGHSVNAAAIRQIVESVSIPIELGGGIRTMSDIDALLSLGVYRVIIGTRAVEDPTFIQEAVQKFGAAHIVAGIDARDGRVAVEGWEKLSDQTALAMAMAMKDMGIQTIVYTDISKDGMLQGPNVAQTKLLSDQTGLDIIASGGVSCMEDLRAVAAANIHGAIIGKALYEKKVDLAEAVQEFER